MHLTRSNTWPVGLRVKITEVGANSTWYKYQGALVGITGIILEKERIRLDREPIGLFDSDDRPFDKYSIDYDEEGFLIYDVYVQDLINDPDGNYE